MNVANILAGSNVCLSSVLGGQEENMAWVSVQVELSPKFYNLLHIKHLLEKMAVDSQ